MGSNVHFLHTYSPMQRRHVLRRITLESFLYFISYFPHTFFLTKKIRRVRISIYLSSCRSEEGMLCRR